MNHSILTRILAVLLAVLLALAGTCALADEAAEAAAIADSICARAAAHEKDVTPLLQSLESDSRRLISLEHRLKTPESVARKLLLNAHDMEISLEEAAQTLHDALRYTFCIGDAEYIAGVDAILKSLTERGFGVARFKNTWGERGYKGINTNLTAPDGYWFEVQFHTPDSYDAKEDKTHSLYEIVRSEESTAAEKAEAAARQNEIFDTVPVPEGAAGYAWKEPSKP